MGSCSPKLFFMHKLHNIQAKHSLLQLFNGFSAFWILDVHDSIVYITKVWALHVSCLHISYATREMHSPQIFPINLGENSISVCLFGQVLMYKSSTRNHHFKDWGYLKICQFRSFEDWFYSILTEGDFHLSVKWILCTNWVILTVDRGMSDSFLWLFVFLRHLHQRIGFKMSHRWGYIVFWFSIPRLRSWVLYFLSLRDFIGCGCLFGQNVFLLSKFICGLGLFNNLMLLSMSFFLAI